MLPERVSREISFRSKTHLVSCICFLGVAAFLDCIPTALALDSTISPIDRYAHAANAGWIDFRPSAENGVRVDETFLSGYAHAANFGWIHFGDGSPANGHSYSNGAADDYGVNLAEDGSLHGFAYAPNIGWIVFESQMGQPRLDFSTGQFHGHAHAANAGWIALSTPSSKLAASSIAPPVDSDGDGISDAWEIQHFGHLATAGSATDADGDGATDRREYLAATEPDDPASNLRIVSFSHNATSADLTFTSSANRRYFIEWNWDLQGPLWTPAVAGFFAPDPGATTSRTFWHPPASQLFFRVVVRKPLQN